MFYNKDKFIEYPNKDILEDVLERDGEATRESFTPFYGCNRRIREQFGKFSNDISISDIIRHASGLHVGKLRANDDGAARGYSAYDVSDYYTRLEDIGQDFIEKYVREILVGFKLDRKGKRESDKNLMITKSFYDEENGVYESESDLIEVKRYFSTGELLKARNKLPYLLKQLHDGSIQYGGSLLSFIIAMEKVYKKYPGIHRSLVKPSQIVEEGVYRMQANGLVGSKFIIENNTGEVLKGLISWIRGDRVDMYDRAYQDLLDVALILSIDLTEEDAREYDREYIRNIVCTYIATNEEYLSTYGYADKKILRMLQPEQLFSVANAVAEEPVYMVRDKLNTNMIADSIASNTVVLKYKYPNEWNDRVADVNRFLAFYCNFFHIPQIKSVKDYEVVKGLLCKTDGNYMFVNVTKIVDRYCGQLYAVVSISGYLILIQEFETSITYLDVNLAKLYYEGTYDEKDWNIIAL